MAGKVFQSRLDDPRMYYMNNISSVIAQLFANEKFISKYEVFCIKYDGKPFIQINIEVIEDQYMMFVLSSGKNLEDLIKEHMILNDKYPLKFKIVSK